MCQNLYILYPYKISVEKVKKAKFCKISQIFKFVGPVFEMQIWINFSENLTEFVYTGSTADKFDLAQLFFISICTLAYFYNAAVVYTLLICALSIIISTSVGHNEIIALRIENDKR